ncbi:MAG TPA: vWA domain-containing protein [Vicinamibacteria bacterium]|nr:vWA domain-containing protein [Vicinamibacteria bacterium]
MAVGASLLSLAFLVAPALVAAPTPRAGRPASPFPAPSSVLSLEASPTSPAARTTKGPTILFLIDNSASLPPLDPEEKRVEALEKMFTFLKGRPYRLILFGGRREIFVDDAIKYRNNGQWTDFYFAFDKARELIAADYPPGADLRLVLITDAILDPSPADWTDMNVPEGVDLKAHVVEKTLALIKEMNVPLYVILVGEPPVVALKGNPERAPGLILDMVQAANGKKAAPFAQSMASFFQDDGVLLKKFVFRVEPQEGLKKIAPIVTRISTPSRPLVEAQFFSALILPMVLFLALLLGILVRQFPGPGDVEVLELSLNAPVHVAADRLHKVEGGWSNTGLSLVGDTKEASATFTYQAATLDLTGSGIDTTGLDTTVAWLLPLPLDELRKAFEDINAKGTKDEKIFVLNLDYTAKNLDPKEAERILTTSGASRRGISATDFLSAKAHLLSDETLRRTLLDPRVQFVGYGKGGERKELKAGTAVRIGPYGFLVQDVGKGGRRDVRLVLHYDRIPSLLGLKSWLPDRFQQVFRFRRSSQRVVS